MVTIANDLWGLPDDPPADQYAGMPHAAEFADEQNQQTLQRIRQVRAQPVSEIPLRRRQFLWDQRIPLGEITLWVGHAGIGKSQAAAWLASQVSRGGLSGELEGIPSPVLYLGSEDSWEYTIAPRLTAADAKLDEVYRIYAETAEGDESVFHLAVDLASLRDTIHETGARVVVLDALLSTMHGSDLVKQGVVRSYLEPLARLAQELNIAVIGLCHFRKSAGADPLHMIAGTAEFGQVVRSAIGFAADREAGDGTCVLSPIKANIARGDLPSVRYRVDPAVVSTPEGDTDVGRFVMLGDTDQGVDELLNREQVTPEDRSERDEAAEWLVAYLTEDNRGGEAIAGEIIKDAEKDGFNKRTIQRARKKAGVQSEKKSAGWMWVYDAGSDSR